MALSSSVQFKQYLCNQSESDEYVRFVAISVTPRALTTWEVEEALEDSELIELRKKHQKWTLVDIYLWQNRSQSPRDFFFISDQTDN